MKKVGILVGREKTFPLSMIEKINARGGGDVQAEFVKIGGESVEQGQRLR